jgi:phage virion morphogenesis protein
MISIEVQNGEVLDYLRRLQARMDDMTPVMDAIGQRLEEQISMRFENEADPDWRPWAYWSESTLRSYPEDGNRRLLDRYGDMLRSLNHQAGSDYVLVGFGSDYAAYHEFGTKHMPRRGLLFSDPDSGQLGSDDEAAILDIVYSYLKAD